MLVSRKPLVPLVPLVPPSAVFEVHNPHSNVVLNIAVDFVAGALSRQGGFSTTTHAADEKVARVTGACAALISAEQSGMAHLPFRAALAMRLCRTRR